MGPLIDVELLIASIEKRPVIWDKTSEAYKYRNLTKAAWHEVCCFMKNDFEELSETEQHNFGKSIIAKWTNIRDSWMRSQKKVIQFNKSCTGFKTKYRYHEKLSFLAKVFDNLTTCSQVTEEMNALHEKTQKEEATAASIPGTKIKEVPSTSNYHRPPNKKRKCADIETRSLKLLKKSEISRVNPDPHILFFESLLPSIINLSEDQVLEFRIGVLALIKDIKQHNHPSYNSAPTNGQSPNSNFQRDCPDPLSNLPLPSGSSDGNPFFQQTASSSSHWFSKRSFHSPATSGRMASSHLPDQVSPSFSVNASRNTAFSVHSQSSPIPRTGDTSPLSCMSPSPSIKSSPSSCSVGSEDLDNYTDFSNDD